MKLALLQARVSSRRLSAKVLRPILGVPMLARQIERIRRCEAFDRLIVATSMLDADLPIADLARNLGVDCYRGSLDDVLDRMYRAAEPHRPSHVIRLTGDCPLADWEVIDRVLEFAVAGDFDFASNTLPPTWPDGLDVEICKFSALEAAWRDAKDPLEREHVMPYLYSSGTFKVGNLENDEDLSRHRWTVDEPADFEFVTRVYGALYPTSPAFTTRDVLDFLAAHPEVAMLNVGIERNAGLVLTASERAVGGRRA